MDWVPEVPASGSALPPAPLLFLRESPAPWLPLRGGSPPFVAHPAEHCEWLSFIHSKMERYFRY